MPCCKSFAVCKRVFLLQIPSCKCLLHIYKFFSEYLEEMKVLAYFVIHFFRMCSVRESRVMATPDYFLIIKALVYIK